MSFLPEEAGTNVVVAVKSDAHVRIQRIGVVDDKLYHLAVMRLLDERNLHATDEEVIIAIHVEEVHQV